VLGENARPQGVQLFRQGGEFGSPFSRKLWKRKPVETRALHVDGFALVFPDAPRVGRKPGAVLARRQHGEHRRIVARHHDEFVVRQNARIQEPEPAVLGRFDRHDVAIQPSQRLP